MFLRDGQSRAISYLCRNAWPSAGKAAASAGTVPRVLASSSVATARFTHQIFTCGGMLAVLLPPSPIPGAQRPPAAHSETTECAKINN